MSAEGYRIEPFTGRSTTDAPRGPDIHYRCRKCGSTVFSQTRESCGCTCDNIWIDADPPILVVRDLSAFEILRTFDSVWVE